MAFVYHRYLTAQYGYCPRALCDKQKVLPVGMSDKVRTSRVKIYCPKCDEVYVPYNKTRLDGASFGTSAAMMFLQSYPSAIVLPPKVYFYEPIIHGFKVAGKRGSKYYEPHREGEISTKAESESLEKRLAPPNKGGINSSEVSQLK